MFRIPLQYYPGITEKLQYLEGKDEHASAVNSRNLTLYMLESLPSLAKENGPKFVYAHFTTTHPPFSFEADGKPLLKVGDLHNSEDFIAGYNKQIEFIDNQLVPVIKQIIKNSTEPPIIIIQSDHGMVTNIDMEDYRPNQILAAFYLPGIQNIPSSKISPVNFFRFVLNNYFGYDLNYLDEKSFQINLRDYSLIPVTDQNTACKLRK